MRSIKKLSYLRRFLKSRSVLGFMLVVFTRRCVVKTNSAVF